MKTWLAVAALGVSIALLAVPSRPQAETLKDAAEAYQRGDYAAAVALYRPLADQGDRHAQAVLGVMYYNGQGVPQDFAQAAQLLRSAADQGQRQAQAALGHMYYNGEGVPQDFERAAGLFRTAAERGSPFAQVMLGAMFSNGEGVPQDFVQAHMWFDLAAAGGVRGAAEGREAIAAQMTAEQIAEAERLARAWQPKE